MSASEVPRAHPQANGGNAAAGTSSAERQQTDRSLRAERAKVDRALEDKASVEQAADEVVHEARTDADAVLQAARDEADGRDDSVDAGIAALSIADARLVQDEALRDERAVADESLRLERAASARALAQLLPLERANTDRYLLTERARSDDAVSNRDDFLGMVTHDLRDLLGGIVLSATLLGRGATGNDSREQTQVAAARIQRYAARMNRLIGDLVDVARIDAGKLAVHPTDGDWTALVEEAIESFRPLAAERDLRLETDPEGAPAPLTAVFDHDRMMQVLANLITNAIKFTPLGGQIRIGSVLADDGLHVSVTDTGDGIPAELLEAVFERFRQAGRNDRRGLGLGLYISRQIVEAHGGRIWAESGHGEGSCLRFTLPPETPTPS
ncbi:MAG TPA: ATP-binding protein [Candidatus Saccharimonadia bacterium]|nr:ATP-binding protein [Candidatus Saccharimonadia bacterium]